MNNRDDIDAITLARKVLDGFQSRDADNHTTVTEDAAEDLVKLICTLIRTEVVSAFVESAETFEERFERAARERADRERCRARNDNGHRCKMMAGHEHSRSNYAHATERGYRWVE